VDELARVDDLFCYAAFMVLRAFFVCAVLGSTAALSADPMQSASPPARRAAVRMEVRDNRVFIPLTVSGPRGTALVATFWVDTGGDSVILSGRLAHQLGLRLSDQASVGMNYTTLRPATKPKLLIAGMPIDLTHVNVFASGGVADRNAFPGVAAAGFLPATVLMKYGVVLDYPKRVFILAQPGTLSHVGTPVKLEVNRKTGFARIEIEVGQQTFGFMLDTGAAYTGISRVAMDVLIREHPVWQHSIGAVGAANMVGKDFDASNELLRIPEVRWGPFALRNVGMVSRPAGVYEKTVSGDMSKPIIGALAGNVLRHFRIELDYAAGLAYLQSDGTDNFADLACVGIIVHVDPNGAVVVSGVSQRDGRPQVAGVNAGDLLLRVDRHEVTGASVALILHYLSGPLAEKKRLTLRRGTKAISVNTFVSQYP
jgi:predicted aspartyl protease